MGQSFIEGPIMGGFGLSDGSRQKLPFYVGKFKDVHCPAYRFKILLVFAGELLQIEL